MDVEKMMIHIVFRYSLLKAIWIFPIVMEILCMSPQSSKQFMYVCFIGGYL